MKTSVEDLREHLFAAIERLNSAERDQLDSEISRAKAVAEVARVMGEQEEPVAISITPSTTIFFNFPIFFRSFSNFFI